MLIENQNNRHSTVIDRYGFNGLFEDHIKLFDRMFDFSQSTQYLLMDLRNIYDMDVYGTGSQYAVDDEHDGFTHMDIGDWICMHLFPLAVGSSVTTEKVCTKVVPHFDDLHHDFEKNIVKEEEVVRLMLVKKARCSKSIELPCFLP